MSTMRLRFQARRRAAQIRAGRLTPVPKELRAVDQSSEMLTFDRFGPLWVTGLIDEPDLTWARSIIRELGFLWDLGYRPTSAFFHFKGGGIEIVGPKGEVRFSSGDDFGDMDARVHLQGFDGRIDDMPHATVGPMMVTRGGKHLPVDYVAQRVAEWAATLRANTDLLR